MSPTGVDHPSGFSAFEPASMRMKRNARRLLAEVPIGNPRLNVIAHSRHMRRPSFWRGQRGHALPNPLIRSSLSSNTNTRKSFRILKILRELIAYTQARRAGPRLTKSVEPSDQFFAVKISKNRHPLGIKIVPSRAVLEAGMLICGLGLELRRDGLAILFESAGDRLCEGNDSLGGGRVRLRHLSQRTANPLNITSKKGNRTAGPIPENRSMAISSAPGKLERLLSVEEVAEITGLSVETLNQWRSQRRGIPFVRLSRNRVRYRRSDLDEFIEANTIVPVPIHPSLRGR